MRLALKCIMTGNQAEILSVACVVRIVLIKIN